MLNMAQLNIMLIIMITENKDKVPAVKILIIFCKKKLLIHVFNVFHAR